MKCKSKQKVVLLGWLFYKRHNNKSMWINKSPCMMLVDIKNCIATIEIGMDFTQKIQNRIIT